MTDSSNSEETNTSDATDPESTADTVGDTEMTLSEEIDDHPLSQGPGGGAGGDADKLFDEMDVGEIDGEALWDQLAGAEADASAFDTFDSPEVGTVDGTEQSVSQGTPLSEAEEAIEEEFTVDQGDSDVDEDEEYVESLINKRIYCQQCPHFSEPPDVSCQHGGTSIVEVREDGQFVVRDCPVVTETGPDRNQLNKNG